MAYFQIQATVVETTANGTITHQIPTFYLDSRVQGITSCQQARKIAIDVLNPAKLESLKPFITVSEYIQG